MTPALTPEARALLRKLAEASLAERESGSSSRVRRLDFIHKVGEERSILALLDALEEKRRVFEVWVAPGQRDKHLEYLTAECDTLRGERDTLRAELEGERLEIEKLEAQRATLLDDREVERQRVRDLTAGCARLKAELAEAVGLLRETRAKIRVHLNGYCFGGPLLHQIDLLLARHQRPPEGGAS